MTPRYLLITSYRLRATNIKAEELMHTDNNIRISRFMMNNKNIFKKPSHFGVGEKNINIQHLRLVGFHIM
jgi:hypothetical protein